MRHPLSAVGVVHVTTNLHKLFINYALTNPLRNPLMEDNSTLNNCHIICEAHPLFAFDGLLLFVEVVTSTISFKIRDAHCCLR